MTAWNLFVVTRWTPAFRNLKNMKWTDWLSRGLLLSISLVFFSLLYELQIPVYRYIQGQEALGPVLIPKLIHLVFLVFFVLFFFSSLVGLLSGLFLARESEWLLATPIPPSRFFILKFWLSLLPSFGILLVLWLPALLAMRKAGLGGAAWVIWGLAAPLPMGLAASSLASLALLTIFKRFSSSKLRRFFYVWGSVFLCAGLFLIRLIQPQRLTDPASATSAAQYLMKLAVPDPWWLPSRWAGDSLCLVATDPLWAMFSFALSCLAAFLLYKAAVWTAKKTFLDAWLESRNAGGGASRPAPLLYNLWKRADSPLAALIIKDLAQIFRRSQQRIQWLFLGCLTLIYLYNLYHLSPSDLGPMRPFLYLLSCLFSSFIVTAVSARFVLPSTCLENGSFWLLRAAPLRLARYLAAKALLGFALVLPLGALLGGASAYFLQPGRAVFWLGFYYLFITTLGVAALHTGLGAAWSRFDLEDPEEFVTGTPGVMAVTFSLLYLFLQMLLLYFPYRQLHWISYSQRFHLDWRAVLIPAALSLALQALVMWLPLKVGRQVLQDRE